MRSKRIFTGELFLQTFFGVVVFFVLLQFVMAFYHSGFFGFTIADTFHQTKLFSNEVYSLQYPGSYKSSVGGDDGRNRLTLDKDQKWGDEYDGYPLLKGMFIITEYKEHTDLMKEAAYDTKEWGNKKTKSINIQHFDALEITAGHDHPLGVPTHTQIFIKNKDDVFSISFVIGDEISKKEYELYKKEFDAIVSSVKFLK